MNKSLINKESLCQLQRIPKMCTNIRRNAGIEAQKWCLWNFLELWSEAQMEWTPDLDDKSKFKVVVIYEDGDGCGPSLVMFSLANNGCP